MTVMDIKTVTQLTPEQTQFALALRRTTEANLKRLEGDSPFPLLTMHYDVIETAARFSCLSEVAVQEFKSLAEVETAAYFARLGIASFYPEVSVVFVSQRFGQAGDRMV